MPFHEYHYDYNSRLLRGEDITPRPQITREHIIKYSKTNGNLLDIGCGSAYKTASYKPFFYKVVGLDPSPDLLATARHWLQQSTITNIELVEGVAENLPFEENFFDVVSSILAWWDTAEVNRVLKSHGVFIMERLGPEDKTTFTRFFGEDKHGMRGACLNTQLDEIKSSIHAKLSPYFNDIEFYDSQWETAYTAEGLWLLLNNTKMTVRNFHPDKDKNAFNNAIKQLEKHGCITLTQNRITVIASKPRSFPSCT